jgi:hypothetical protein
MKTPADFLEIGTFDQPLRRLLNGIVPTASAVAKAVYDAIGIQITELPITAEKIYLAMRRKRNGF